MFSQKFILTYTMWLFSNKNFVRKSCIWKPVKKLETITRKKVFKHPLGFDQESVRKLLILISEDSSIKNNVNDFGVKSSIIYCYREYFLVSKNHIQMLWVFNSHRADRADTGKWCLCYMKLGQSAGMIFQI